MRFAVGAIFLFLVFSGFWSCSSPPRTSPEWKLVWSDDFGNDGRPDPSKWNCEIANAGWVNRELQAYTGRIENSRVSGGNLVITARHEELGSANYTSARLVSRPFGHWRYGKIEVRAELPSGRGTWPAIWLHPMENTHGKWPDSGEIDIMEHVGFDPGVIHATTHSRRDNWVKHTQKTAQIVIPTATAEFHVYSVEWGPDLIETSVDGRKFFSFAREAAATWESWPFDHDFFLILNLAVGGDWGGKKGVDDSAFPQELKISTVKVYQRLDAMN